MARYCTKCGRKLADGAICPCRVKQGSSEEGHSEIPRGKTGVAFWKLLGLNDPDYDKSTDYYERGKAIVPDLVSPCEGEIPVKQYHLVNIRARLIGMWAEGRLMVTNKRILFRASGRSFVGRTLMESEYTMDEISGIQISQGVRFSLFDFLIGLLLLSTSIYIPAVFLREAVGWFSVALFFLAGLVGIFLLPRRQYRWKLVCIGLMQGSCILSMFLDKGDLNSVIIISALSSMFMTVLVPISIFFLIMAGMKAAVDIQIMCKSGTAAAVNVCGLKRDLPLWTQILPTQETERSIQEVGAIITDIQQLGDYGIEKWKELFEAK